MAVSKETGTEFGQGQRLDSISLSEVKANIRVKARTKSDLTKCLFSAKSSVPVFLGHTNLTNSDQWLASGV